MIIIPHNTIDVDHEDFGPRKLEVYHNSVYGWCWELHEMMDQGFLEVPEGKAVDEAVSQLVEKLKSNHDLTSET